MEAESYSEMLVPQTLEMQVDGLSKILTTILDPVDGGREFLRNVSNDLEP
jgi:hypothetical protein